MVSSFQRLLSPPSQSFFLFGPRSVGKSHWLKKHYPDAAWFDLLENRLYLELSRDPQLLESKVGNRPPNTWICIDEVQRVPDILNEVHRLIEKKKWKFALSGSSARKLKRGGANLLAGRAITKHMEGLVAEEMGKPFDLTEALKWGSLPLVVLNPAAATETLSAYVHTYIREEIKEEGLVRKTEPFLRFLEIAALLNGQQVNKENIAREAKVPRSTVDVYFSILEDTLLGNFLPAYRPEAKVREQVHPKFYWFDNGVARAAANLLYDPPDSLWLGHALETFFFHELRVYNHTQSKHRPIYFYRTGAGNEIDFLVETKKRTTSSKPHLVAIEVKHGPRWQRKWEAPMRSLAVSNKVKVERMFGVYQGKDSYHFDGIEILPVGSFLKKLYKGEVF
ncbi:MAG: DUF4143 domain-containing protein [Deltaproteobacteria bacterium]|nr:DUF4143 domain-containing protein [Deltaproteobacteria bacterium]